MNFLEREDSDYDDETLNAANEGFYHWEEHEFEEAEPFLRDAALRGHSYSMCHYAILLLDRDPCSEIGWKLMKRSAERGNDEAIDYIDSRLEEKLQVVSIK